MDEVKKTGEITVRDLVALVICFAICLAAAAVGRIFAPDAWYQALNQPALTPPNWIFAPVWSTLYAMMAVSVWLVWRELPKPGSKLAIGVFLFQLALNVSWSWQFFGRHEIGHALINILTLDFVVLATVFLFAKYSRIAAMMLVPYLMWISFASYLNFDFWRLNG